MSLWRYSLAALLLFVIVAKHALNVRYDGSLLDYISAIPTAIIPLGIAILLALRKRVEGRTNAAVFVMPTVAGLAFITLLGVTAR